ncbi:MAG TPA: hypothetical protein VGK67_28965 [Myxococcales bacterium]|jgi:hypothetical protein
MGFFDKVKQFAGGKNTAHVEVLSLNDKAPAAAVFAISDDTLIGSMKVIADQTCTMLAMKYEVLLRTETNGQWGNVIIASNKDTFTTEMTAGQSFEHAFKVNGIDLEKYLGFQNYNDLAAVVGHPKIKLLVNCIADVKGSPFDPCAEVEVKLGPSKAGPVLAKTTVIEGNPADIASFPVGDSVLKGTVEVTGRGPCVLTATRYEIHLELQTDKGPVDVVVAKDQTPKLVKNPLSISFGGTNINFPLKMGKGDKAVQTWMVSDIDLKAKLKEHGFDPDAAAGDSRVKLVVMNIADVEGQPDAAKARTEVRLT